MWLQQLHKVDKHLDLTIIFFYLIIINIYKNITYIKNKNILIKIFTIALRSNQTASMLK